MVCLTAQLIPYSSWYFSQMAFWPSTTGADSLAWFIWETHSVSSWRSGSPMVTALLKASLEM